MILSLFCSPWSKPFSPLLIAISDDHHFPPWLCWWLLLLQSPSWPTCNHDHFTDEKEQIEVLVLFDDNLIHDVVLQIFFSVQLCIQEWEKKNLWFSVDHYGLLSKCISSMRNIGNLKSSSPMIRIYCSCQKHWRMASHLVFRIWHPRAEQWSIY